MLKTMEVRQETVYGFAIGIMNIDPG